MELYIDNIMVETEDVEQINPNMIFRSIDSFNPSAVKTDTSKTMSLPDTVNVNKVFSIKKDKYDYILMDNNNVVMRGYCVLDNVTRNKYKKTYNITLYSNLADFFYNLKGTEENPKKLSDMKWGWVDVDNEDDILFTQNVSYVYNSWNYDNSQKSLKRTFKYVPCECDNYIDKEKTIINNNNELFPLTGPNDSTCLEYNNVQYLLVESEENTSYAKNNFHTTQMPLGISYRDLILTCCNPENNGGYTVELDSSFFNEDNPYWTKPYILKDTIFKYDANKDTDTFGGATDNGRFIYPYLKQNLNWDEKDPVGGDITMDGNSTIWVSDDTDLTTDYPIFGNKLFYHIGVILHTNARFENIPTGEAPYFPMEYFIPRILLNGGYAIKLSIKNNDTNEVIYRILEEHSDRLDFNLINNEIPDEYFRVIEGNITIPDDWTNISFYTDFNTYGETATPNSSWERKVIGSETECYMYIPASSIWVDKNDECKTSLMLETDYFNNTQAFIPPTWTKEEIFENMLTPFEYLINYTKMFNLRFIVDINKKSIQILTWDNFYTGGYVDIDNNIDYNENYISSRKVIDEGNIKFNIEPDTNDTIQKYTDTIDKNVFDKVVKVSDLNDSNKDYIASNKIKIGSKNRFTSAFLSLLRSDVLDLLYNGFNQQKPYTLNYIANDYQTSKNIETSDYSLRYYEGVNQYDFLQIKDINNTIVMFEGLRDVVTYKYTDSSGSHTIKPAAVISDISKESYMYADGVPYYGGIRSDVSEYLNGKFLSDEYNVIYTYKIPIFGLCGDYVDFNNGLSYTNIKWNSLNVNSNIYDSCFGNMIKRIYTKPEEVKCRVQYKDKVDLRKIYYFNYNYWIISEVNEYNFNDDFVETTFLKYQNN